MTGLSRDAEVEAVAIRHFGWRMPILSMFPNAITAWPVALGYRHLPLFNIAVIWLLLAAAFLVWRALRRARARRAAERAWDAARRTVLPVIDAGHEDWRLRDRPSSGRPDDPGRGA